MEDCYFINNLIFIYLTSCVVKHKYMYKETYLYKLLVANLFEANSKAKNTICVYTCRSNPTFCHCHFSINMCLNACNVNITTNLHLWSFMMYSSRFVFVNAQTKFIITVIMCSLFLFVVGIFIFVFECHSCSNVSHLLHFKPVCKQLLWFFQQICC